jgi:hypothetical protein
VENQVIIGLNAVIVAVTEDVPRILTVLPPSSAQSPQLEALPSGPFDPHGDRTLELGLRRWVREQTGLELGYVEQLYTFGDRYRDPQEQKGGPRMVSIAYLALVREGRPSGRGDAIWRDWYRFLPWEDWRSGRPAMIDRPITGRLAQWAESARSRALRGERRERSDINFGLGGAPWVPERVLERYELLYEVGLVQEAYRNRAREGPARDRGVSAAPRLGEPLALDHRRILATALGRLRGKLKYRPVVFELLPAAFSLLQLQRVLEALSGVVLHKQNLRRLVESGGLVEGTGELESRTRGRPAELFRFRRDVLRERPAPGVALPGLRH